MRSGGRSNERVEGPGAEAFARARESDRRFHALLDHLGLLAVLLDSEGRLTYANRAFLELTGYGFDEVVGHDPFVMFLSPDDVGELRETHHHILEQRPNTESHDVVVVTRTGERRYTRWTNTALRDAHGESIGTAHIGEDLTERRQAELARAEQQRKIERLSRIRAVMSGISSAMLRSTDGRELLQEACRVATSEGVFPVAWATEIGADGASLEIVASAGPSPDSLAFVQEAIRGAIPIALRPTHHAIRARGPFVINDIETEPTVAPVREDLRRQGYRSGAAFPLFVRGRPYGALVLLAREAEFFDQDEVDLLAWMSADLSFALEHIDAAKRLDHLAYYDALTGIANARLFADRLSQFVHAAREDESAVVVVVFDLVEFTRINDSLGREVGDELLKRVAERLESILEEPYAFGRIAGDTFAVARPRASESVRTRTSDLVLSAFDEPYESAGGAIRLAAQAGVAVCPTDGVDAETVFQSAESALALAKASAERISYFSLEMNARIARRRALEAALRDAIARREFVLHYQPRVDLTSGALVAAEALVRWQQPERGLVPPSEFVGVAEETGLIVPIGEWVIETVCAQQAQWLAAGLGIVPVAVNLSSSQFESGDLVRIVREALARHGLEPALLELELTESAVMKDPAAAASMLAALRGIGVKIALDDFGTGYSSLAHLKRFPFDSVKIDRSFVTDLTTDADDAAIATAIIAMAHRLELTVVAEGVETAGQLAYLRAEGCDEMQGNHFSPPVSHAAFAQLLRSGRRMVLPASPAEGERTLLLVDNEPGVLSALIRLLRRDGYRILAASTGREALELLSVNAVQVVISDQRMPGMSGTEFLNIVRQLHPDTVRIILSGYTELEAVTDAVNRGAVFKFLTKPWDDDLLRAQVRDAFRRYRPERRAAS